MPQTGFTLEIDGFKGPLGLLLDLIEQHKLQVSDISLARVSDDYIKYIQDRSRIPLSETAQFIVVASTLLLIKSRSLLPTIELTQDEEQDIRELENRLALYTEARRAARLLKQQWSKRSFLPLSVPQREITFAPGSDCTVSNFHAIALRLTEALPSFAKVPTAHIAREIRLDDVIESLIERMRSTFTDSFRRVTSGAEKVEAIVNFLALLELVKRGALGAEQQGNFSDITMTQEEVSMPRYGK